MYRPRGGFRPIPLLIQWHMLRRLVAWGGTVVVVCALVGMLTTSADLFSLMTRGILPAGSFVVALATLLPTVFSHTIPVTATLAIGFMYYGWQRDQEIVVLRMAGLSDAALALPGLAAAAVAALFTAAMSLYLQPLAFRVFEDIRYAAVLDLGVSALDEGYLQQVAPDLSLSFRARLGPTLVEGVTVLDRRKNATFAYIVAERAQFALEPRSATEEPKQVLMLEKGSYLRQSSHGETVDPVAFERLAVPLPPIGDAPRLRPWRGFYEETIDRLVDPPAAVRERPELFAQWIAEGQSRLIAPLLCLSYAALALAVTLRSGSQRQFAGILRGILVAGFLLAWNHLMGMGQALVVRFPDAMLAYDLMALVPAAIGIVVVQPRGRLWRSMARRLARSRPFAVKTEVERSA